MIRTFFASAVACLVITSAPVFAQASQTPVAEAAVGGPEFNPVTITVTASGNLRDMANKAGYDGTASAGFLFIVPEGVNILGQAGGKRGKTEGGPGLVTGTWPEETELWLMVKGQVYGGGGRGGNGGDLPGSTDGGKGGDAVVANAPITIVVLKTGSIKAGGGGGAGAEGAPNLGGSGGGGGFPNGEPGQPGSPTLSGDGQFSGGDWGRAGTIAGGGLGGSRGIPGGRGGDPAVPGVSLNRVGGAPGNAVRLNGYDVVVLNGGQIYGESY